jgi:hypothetical protein
MSEETSTRLNKRGNVRITYHEAHLRNSCCLEKNNRYYIFVCVCVGGGRVGLWAGRVLACAQVVLQVQHATRRIIVICGLSGSTAFFDIFS